MQANVQDSILVALHSNKTHVTVYMINGFQMKGIIEAFDQYVVVVRNEDKQQVVYKHAISTITPDTPIQLP